MKIEDIFTAEVFGKVMGACLAVAMVSMTGLMVGAIIGIVMEVGLR